MVRRQDRKVEMIKKFKDLSFEQELNFFSAVDEIQVTEEIKTIFKNNKFNWRSDIVGCALSHIYLWRELVASKHEYFLILKDDTDVHSHFKGILPHVFNHIKKFGIDFLFLGHHYRDFRNYEFSELNNISITPLDKRVYGGTGGYIISRKGAQSLLDWIAVNGCNHPIDDEIIQWNNSSHLIFSCEPHIIKNTIRGDVQHEFPRLF